MKGSGVWRLGLAAMRAPSGAMFTKWGLLTSGVWQ